MAMREIHPNPRADYPKFPEETIHDRPVLVLDTLPKPMSYHVIIEPRKPPETSAGGIVLAQKTRRANRACDYIGKVLSIGSLAFKAKTPELDLSLETGWPNVGDWVAFKQHAGQKLKLRRDANELRARNEEDEDYLIVLNDTDIIAVFKSDQDTDQFYSWV
jgi:co-chaperonin GroES (HSP10)